MQIETKRLILRPPVEDDWRDIAEGVSDLEVTRLMASIPHPYKDTDAVQFVARVLKSWSETPQTEYIFFLESKISDKVIGLTGLLKVDRFNGTAATGSWIRRDHWRKGYILEAKIPVLDFAFDTLGLRRIETCAFADNIASQAMSEKLGFISEGIARQSTRCRATDEIHDEIHYGLLREDWQVARARLTGV